MKINKIFFSFLFMGLITGCTPENSSTSSENIPSVEVLITFEKNDGQGGTDSIIATVGLPMPEAIAPQKDGFVFAGYYENIEDGIRYYNFDMSSTRNWDKESDTTLYALWRDEDLYYYTEGLKFSSDWRSSYVSHYDGLAEEVIIPSWYGDNPVTTISAYAFKNCKHITSIIIPDCVRYFRQGAFYGCEKLTDIVLPEKLYLIDMFVFNGCDSIISIDIPEKVELIAPANWWCKSLQSINVHPDNVWYSSIDGVFFDKDQEYLYTYPEAKVGSEYRIPNTVTDVESESFHRSRLQTITIPENVLYIAQDAFAYSEELTTIYVEGHTEKPTTWSNNWLRFCSAEIIWGC